MSNVLHQCCCCIGKSRDTVWSRNVIRVTPLSMYFFFFLCRTWTYAGVNQSCLAGPNINATCKITLSFCNKIPTICNGLSSACVQASNFTGKNDTAVFSIGQYTQDPFSRSEKGIKNVKNKFLKFGYSIYF